MLGFFRFQSSVKATVNGITGLLAPVVISNRTFGPLSNQIFSDPYVIGFLQSFAMFWMQINRSAPINPAEQLAIFSYSYERLVPKNNMASFIKETLPQLNKETHPLHQNYKIGRNEGQAYVEALKENNDIEINAALNSFTDFIKRNYIQECA